MHLLTLQSSYLGVPALPWLPRLLALNCFSPRLCSLRQKAQNSNKFEARLLDARVLFLAHDTPSTIRWLVRVTILYTPPWKPSRMGDSLAQRSESTTRSDGRRGCLVRPDRRAEYSPSSMAVCRFGREEAAKREILGRRRLGRDGSQDCTTDSNNEE